jgi:hypothetical protein
MAAKVSDEQRLQVRTALFTTTTSTTTSKDIELLLGCKEHQFNGSLHRLL